MSNESEIKEPITSTYIDDSVSVSELSIGISESLIVQNLFKTC
ncbi:hypothetical protein [Okeania sp. SIO3I5]|nr:hypothetical protein [Okeania sp. SIO3I5]